MEATGIWKQIEKRLQNEEIIHHRKLSEAYRLHFPMNEINQEMIAKIEKMEQFGQTPVQIAETLHFPKEVLYVLATDIPELKTIEIKTLKIEK